MTIFHQRFLGYLLAVVGLLVAVFSQQIVFPGLEYFIGIEAMVGRENVVYQSEGGYLFTNPGAMVLWISTVAATGLVVAFAGSWMIFRARRENREPQTYDTSR